MNNKPILCLDFDGVIHSYTSGWQGPGIASDPPVEGALEFIVRSMKHFDVNVFSSRSNQLGGVLAMRKYLEEAFKKVCAHSPTPEWLLPEFGYSFKEESEKLRPDLVAYAIVRKIQFPAVKPPAFLTIDDRAITFTGEWPEPRTLLDFKPWNK